MKKTLNLLINNLTYNLKTLLIFELIYRTLGILLIYPLTRYLFNLSIILSGESYITNRFLIAYLTRPTTLLVFLILLILFTLYISIELIFLAIIYDFGYHEQDLSLRVLFNYGLTRIPLVLKKYHVALIIPTLFFWILVEFVHIVGIASTIEIPSFVTNQVQMLPLLNIVFISMIGLIALGYLESTLTMHSYVLDGLTIKHTFKKNRLLLRRKRLKYIIEFILLNALLNGVLYLFYTLIILLIALLVFITRGQALVLGVLLTVLYTLYSAFVYVSTLVLIPINFALLSAWHYQNKEESGQKKQLLKFSKIIRKPFESTLVKRTLIATLAVVFALNISIVFGAIRSPQNQIEFLSYAEIIAHRGASKQAPENTIAAIELALEQGADAVEFDVRLSKDLIAVLVHDTTLGRTTNDTLNRRVDQLTYEELSILDAGSWFSSDFAHERIPTLEDALIVIQNRGVAFIELKVNSLALEYQVVNLVETLNMTDQVVVLSFYRDQLTRIKNANADIKTLLLMPSFIGNTSSLINDANIDFYGFERSFIISRPELIEQLHQNNKGVYVWTLSNTEQISQATNFDFTGLITSLPVEAREIEYAKNRQFEFLEILASLFN
ncbi:MAG: glycerophosphodiester phosphodiesterase family protein [Acholeplasmataceae bacterium]